jgi:hypothetical protein
MRSIVKDLCAQGFELDENGDPSITYYHGTKNTEGGFSRKKRKDAGMKNEIPVHGVPISKRNIRKILARVQNTNNPDLDEKGKPVANDEGVYNHSTRTFVEAKGEDGKSIPKGVSPKVEALLANLMLKYGTDPNPEILANFVGDGKVHTVDEKDPIDKTDVSDINQTLMAMDLSLVDMMNKFEVTSSHAVDASDIDIAKEAKEAFEMGNFEKATRLYHGETFFVIFPT